MPIQVPRVGRLNSPQPASVGRSNEQVVDTVKPMMAVDNARERLIGAVGTYMENEQVRVANTAAREAAQDYHRYQDEKLVGKDGIAYRQGDPSEDFKAFDDEVKKKKEEILERYNGTDAVTKAAVERELGDTDARFYDKRTTLYGKRKTDWEDKVYNDDLQLHLEGARSDIIHVDLKSPDATTAPLDRRLYDIEKRIAEHSEGRGLVVTREERDEKGDIVQRKVYQQGVKLEIAKKQSQAIQNAIENLNNAGQVDGAQMLLEKYGDRLAVDMKKSLRDSTEKEIIEKKANQAFMEAMRLPQEAGMAKLSKLGDATVMDKAMEKLDSYHRRMENAQNRNSKRNYEAMAETITAIQTSGAPMFNINDLENNAEYKRRAANMTEKQKSALRNMIINPKESNLEVKEKFYDHIANGDLEKMSYGDFLQATSGLSGDDRKKFEKDWKEATTETDVEKRQITKLSQQNLVKQMQAQRLIKEKPFGGYDNSSKIKITQMQDELREIMRENPPAKDKVEDYVKQFVAKKKVKEAFNPEPELTQKKRFQGMWNPGQTLNKKKEAAAAKAPQRTMTPDEKMGWIRKFKEVTGETYDPKKGHDMRKFMEKYK